VQDDGGSVNCLVESGLRFAADHVAGDLQNFDPVKFVTGLDSLQEHVSLVCGLSYVRCVWRFASKGNYKLSCKPTPSIDKSEYTHYICLLQPRTIQVPVNSTQKNLCSKHASQNRQSPVQH